MTHEGTVVNPDPQSVGYPANPKDQPNVRKVWPHATALNQGSDGSCTGFAAAGLLAADPVSSQGVTDATGFAIWEATKKQPNGATVNSAARVLREWGAWDSWEWANTAEELRRLIIGSGPCAVSSYWRTSMYRTSRRNQNIRVDKSETPRLQHAYAVVGYHPAKRLRINGKMQTVPAFLILNSWGEGWGGGWVRTTVRRFKWVRKWSKRKRRKVRRRVVRRRKVWRSRPDGTAWITMSDMDWLLSEAYWSEKICSPVGRHRISPPVN